MAVIKMTPNEIRKLCGELEQVNHETKKLIQRYNELLQELNSGWEGEEQTQFNDIIINRLENMERLIDISDEYSKYLFNTAMSYEACESSLASGIARFIE